MRMDTNHLKDACTINNRIRYSLVYLLCIYLQFSIIYTSRMSNLTSGIVQIIRENFASNDFIPLHPPVFSGNEEKYVLETIKSTFVSSVGAFVDQSEQLTSQITGIQKSIAVVNGTAALHIGLREVGVTSNTEVITQSLSFVATSNAISYLGASPVFVDVDLDSLGLSPV